MRGLTKCFSRQLERAAALQRDQVDRFVGDLAQSHPSSPVGKSARLHRTLILRVHIFRDAARYAAP